MSHRCLMSHRRRLCPSPRALSILCALCAAHLAGCGQSASSPPAEAITVPADVVAADVVAADVGTDAGTDADGSQVGAAADGGADAAGLPLAVTAGDFDCMLDWTAVRRFHMKNTHGHLAEALAVADNPDGGKYPVGTFIQLVPSEAMVKHEVGWNTATADWEFFFLKASAAGTQILVRGGGEVVNGFGGNCLGCHALAAPKWDMVCEVGHGCADLQITTELIEALQQTDPRCK